MNPTGELITRALNAAALDLDWLSGGPNGKTRFALSLEVLRDPTATERVVADSETAGIRSKGGHSDPTGEAAISGNLARLDAQAKGLRRDLADVLDTVQFVRESVTRALYDCELDHPAGYGIHDAMRDVMWCLTIPHTAEAALAHLKRIEAAERALELFHACDHLAHGTQHLRVEVARVLTSAVKPPSEKPKQKPRECCRSCKRFGVESDLMAGSRQWCSLCEQFRRNQQCMPTEAIVRTWASGSSRVTPGMILEAKAAASAPKRKRKGAA